MNQLMVLLEPAKNMLSQIGSFILSVIGVLLILVVGWLIAEFIVKRGLTRLLRVLDQLADRIELDTLLAKGGISYSLSELIGIIGYWLTILLTFIVALNAVGLTVAADLLNKVVLYIPNVLAAIFILVIGMFVAVFLRNLVQATANNAGLIYANALSKIVEVAVMIFAVLIALEQLNIGTQIINLVVTIVLASLGLGLALAVGLGCKDLVGKAVSDFVDKLKKK